LRTQKYTLENYLLDPECWFKHIRPHTRRTPKPGWNSLEETQATIESLYRECLPLAAYNRTLQEVRDINYASFTALPASDKSFKEHPKALMPLDNVPNRLRYIQTVMKLNQDLGQRYVDILNRLEKSSLEALEIEVSGKYVMNLLREDFPLNISGKQAWDDILGAYIDICPNPPEDLTRLIDLILHDAHS
jgi:hypothetical protein